MSAFEMILATVTVAGVGVTVVLVYARKLQRQKEK